MDFTSSFLFTHENNEIKSQTKIYDFTVYVLLFQSDREHELKICEQREKQRELIHQLKSQLEDLENYAYEVISITGNSSIIFITEILIRPTEA